MVSRRVALKATMGVVGLSFTNLLTAFSDRPNRVRIGACDWSIGEHSSVDAMMVAKKIGLDGVQVSLGKQGNDMHLRQKSIQLEYKKAARQNDVEVGGIAIGELNSIPYKEDPRTEQWVSDSIDVAKAMGCKVILLAFFGKGDLIDDKEGVKEVIRRLKIVAPKAEKKGIILGIESWLSAKQHMEIIDAVGSPNVQVYYDVANSTKMGYNIYEEIRWLGNKNICEFHAKENGFLLGQGKVDFVEFRKAIDDIDFEGWIQIEGAVPPNGDMLESYLLNNKYIRSVLKT